jgi:hypothetical protein
MYCFRSASFEREGENILQRVHLKKWGEAAVVLAPPPANAPH